MKLRMLDLFAGRLGWARAFAARGWECVAVDLTEPENLPAGVKFWRGDVCDLGCVGKNIGPRAQIYGLLWSEPFDFICASSPCEEFSKFGMRCFFPDPPYPIEGIRLFNWTRQLLWASGVPWVMENVRAAQKFVGDATGHCGPFYLWGTGVPPIVPQGIIKGMTRKALGHYEYEGEPGWNTKNESANRRQDGESAAGLAATIPPELANCVAEYAERIAETTWGPFALNQGM